jgi:transposase
MVISNGDTAFANDWRRARSFGGAPAPSSRRRPAVPAGFPAISPSPNGVSKQRRLVERFVCDRTQFRRIAARHEKTGASNPAAIHLAATRFALECMSTDARA